MILMTTSLGDITLELYPDKAPISVGNFLTYVDEGFYDGTVFHRVIPKFMIQGGGFTPGKQQKKPRAAIHSAPSQFFINLSDNAFLNHGTRNFGYAVFGKVIKGTEVVDKIAGVKTGHHGPQGDVPQKPVMLQTARRLAESNAR